VETAPPFNDILGHWAQADIQSMSQNGIAKGYGDGGFHPDGEITRAEFSALLYRIAGLSEAEYAGAYSDVTAKDWSAGIAQSAYNNGFIPTEMTENGFLGDTPVTREEMAALACNACAVTTAVNSAALDGFSDKGEIAPWAENYIAKMIKNGFMQGVGENRFDPRGNATRAEATALVKRIKDKLF
jgi:hypothetical protein